MYLNPQERQALRDASIGGIVAIRQLVAQLKQVNPQAFHTEQTLATRMFFHGPPPSTPCKGYVGITRDSRIAPVPGDTPRERPLFIDSQTTAS
ncbi:hypothetical protein KNO81_39490 [Paraburkholderia sediminicola]|nr:hypothetical protein [Paraburkholderia sediminicola]